MWEYATEFSEQIVDLEPANAAQNQHQNCDAVKLEIRIDRAAFSGFETGEKEIDEEAVPEIDRKRHREPIGRNMKRTFLQASEQEWNRNHAEEDQRGYDLACKEQGEDYACQKQRVYSLAKSRIRPGHIKHITPLIEICRRLAPRD